MQGIREKRKIVFSEIQLSEETIRALADLVYQEFLSLQISEQKESTVLFSLDTNANSAFESMSPEIFQNTEILNGNRIVKINMKFNTKDLAKSIEFQCVEALDKDSIENYLYVSGDNSNWVNGVIGRLNILLINTERSPRILKYKDLSSLTLTLLFNYVFYKLFYKGIMAIKIEWISSFLLIVPLAASFIFITKLFDYLENLWPISEINIGQQRVLSYSEKRKKIYWIFSAILIPIIVGIVYDLVKTSLN